ncbi:MAG TPA: ECF-type sigma factor [Pyrinomonadaceae bacterium]|nr:ECF-type sigma factor [Pyrinomonadaceae bacterium]
MAATREVTRNLIEWRNGNEAAIEKILPVVYDELRRSARRNLRRESADTSIQTIELINEAYLKLVDQRESDWQNRAHFFAVAARVMRNILVDRARARQFAKRGGGVRKVSMDEVLVAAPERDVNVIDLHEALIILSDLDERKSRIVELRYFAGLSFEETAEVLGISAITVKREWLKAKAWLYQALHEK